MESVASIPFRPSHMIVLSELPDSEKQKYYEALLDNDCKLFTVTGEGARVADMRILAPGVKKAPADSPIRARMTAGEEGAGAQGAPSRATLAAVANKTRAELLADEAIATKRVLGMACREYPRFTASIIASADAAKPKARPLPWLMRFIEEVYDAR